MTAGLRSVLDRLRPGMRVLLSGGAGEPTGFLDALAAEPDRADGVTFVGAWIPTVNRFDVASLAPGCRAEGFFASEAVRASFEVGRFAYLPLDYSQIYRFLGSGDARIDLAVATVAPAQDGRVSLGIAHDFLPALAQTAATLVGLVNAKMAAARDGQFIAADRFEVLAEVGDDLVTLAPSGGSAAAIGEAVASLVRDGDVVEVGIGRLGAAVLNALRDHRGLGVHAGMITDEVLDLFDAGAVTQGITTGIAVGTAEFEARVATHEHVRFRTADITHGQATLATIPRLAAVNFVLEVDLFGQVNAERIGGRLVSGRGGLADFARGARHGGGQSIVALASVAGRNRQSRIVPVLGPGPATLTRGDVDFVVTEHGIADLRHSSIDACAERLIAVADPTARPGLAEAWTRMRRAM
ncbi:MAG TPA: acetyl-CoA hydrolase/transferase C-terminal domain-containing protein [Microvirga sp.]|nr:acetyl-CoA hydrolase/transferase C-terminal domain-containing protein [Microvirga sp.]